MGAETFSHIASGATAREAFEAAVRQAQYDHGHSGYTGTIAEKDSFITLAVSDERLAEIKKSPWFDSGDDDELWAQVDDKWGPAGCIDLKDGRFLFFGWASS